MGKASRSHDRRRHQHDTRRDMRPQRKPPIQGDQNMSIQVAAHGPAVRPVTSPRHDDPSATRPAPLMPAARVLQGGRVPAQLSFFFKRV
jgi:hypothetical protein